MELDSFWLGLISLLHAQNTEHQQAMKNQDVSSWRGSHNQLTIQPQIGNSVPLSLSSYLSDGVGITGTKGWCRVPHVGHCGELVVQSAIQGQQGLASRDEKMKKAGKQGDLGEDTEISQNVEWRLDTTNY